MSDEIPAIRYYYRVEGPAVVLRSADPAFAVSVVAGRAAFEDLRRRNPGATFELEPQGPRRRRRAGSAAA